MVNKKIQSEMSFEFELFFNLSPDLLCIAGYDGFFKKINDSVSKTLGYTMNELYERPINDFIHHEDRNTTSKVRHQLTLQKPLLNFENRYVTKGGEIVWLSWTSLPVESDKLIFAIAKNITHKKIIEAERNALLTHLTEINKELKQLTYTTSHDLRSPVNNLLSVFGLLDNSKISDKETLEILNILKLSGENLKQTVNSHVDMLSGKDKLHADIEEVDFDECLRRVIYSVNSLIQSSKATIEANFAAVKKVMFNKAFLESIFLNLITNAIKYAKHDCVPAISISADRENAVTRLIITDNCRGFDMDKVKDKIFGLHQKFHDHTDSKGIGLYLVHSHVTNLGGRIEVKSTVNEGTTFTIFFKD